MDIEALRYSRNHLLVTKEQQQVIKNAKVIFGGVGLGSVIGEVALRFGFENFVFLDMDNVELSNLNRQNYRDSDVGHPKVEGIAKRLKAINPSANVTVHHVFLEEANIRDYVSSEFDLAINALDYDNNAPFVFDDACRENNIPVIHPGNFSWAATAFIIQKHQTIDQFKAFHGNHAFFKLVDFMIAQIETDHQISLNWVKEILTELKQDGTQFIPQTSIGANLVAGQTVSLMYDILFKPESIKPYPYIYYLGLR